LVPLSLTGGDAGALAWAGRISRLAGSREVVFCHAAEAMDIPEGIRRKYPFLLDPLEEMLRGRMEELVRGSWAGPEGVELKFRVEKNVSEVYAVLNAVVEHASDLVVVGREAFGSGLAVRLARKAPCSVMAVPEGADAAMERILVPTDFSDNSLAALDVAVAFAEAGGLASIDSLHVCELGPYTHRLTVPEAEIKAFAEEYARDKHTEYSAKADLRGIELAAHQVVHAHIPAAILNFARTRGSSLIVAGCRGQHAMTALLLGGNVEQLLELAPVPVIAAKVKGTGRGLLESLFGPFPQSARS
jgi:nucleotide-binding universal stress UspA family protein